jgi:hypothetical protein
MFHPQLLRYLMNLNQNFLMTHLNQNLMFLMNQ